MGLKSPLESKFELPDDILQEFYCEELSDNFFPSIPESSFCKEIDRPALFTIDLNKVLSWLHDQEVPRLIEREICGIPVLLYVPDFSTQHLLFHYDGSPNSADIIRKFILNFGKIIQDSKATIISPSFIPKSKIREEQEIIQLVASATQETSFIKFNFSKIGDFWSYGIKHNCTLLVTSKNYQAELTKVLFHFYNENVGSRNLSFYLSK